MSFDKWMHYEITTCIKMWNASPASSLSATLQSVPPRAAPDRHGIMLCSSSLFRVSCEWNHTACTLLCLSSLTLEYFWDTSICSTYLIWVYWLSTIPLDEYTTLCWPFTCVDIWIAYHFCLLQIKPAWTLVYKPFGGRVFILKEWGINTYNCNR